MFVAAFIGSPSMNLYEGVARRSTASTSVQIGTQRVALAPESLAKRPALQSYDGQRVVVGIRPEDFEDAAVATDAPADRRLKATVRLVEALGSELMVHFELDDAKRVNSGDPDAPEELLGEGVANAVARFSPRSRVRVDEDVEISVATENLHFFDAETHSHLVRSALAERRPPATATASALDRAGEDAADEEPLEEEEHGQRTAAWRNAPAVSRCSNWPNWPVWAAITTVDGAAAWLAPIIVTAIR